MGNIGGNLLRAKPLTREPSKREEIVDECIKEMKKEIYYRNLHLKYKFGEHR